jgi:hypothetical protein
MFTILAHGGGGKPLGPTDCFIAASIFAILAGWFVSCSVSPTLRHRVRWGKRGRNGPASLQSCIAWAFFTATWSVGLLSQGLQYRPIISRTGWLLGTGFIAVLAAAAWDAARRRHDRAA